MAVGLVGWFDDSWDGNATVVCSLAGYIATKSQWEEEFEPFWQMTMDTHGVPWLHMNEFANPKGEYAKWYCVKGDPEKGRKEQEKAQFLSACAHVIGTTGLIGFGATVRVADVARFNLEKKQKINPFSLALYGAALDIRLKIGREPVQLFFDRTNNVHDGIKYAEHYAETDKFYPDVTEVMQFHPIQKCFTFDKIRPLQAADFAAYELRKRYEKVHEWFEIEDKPLDSDARWQHFGKWSLDNFQAYPPPFRKSFVRLTSMAHIEGIVWDYRALCIAHEARGGVWSVDS